MRKKLVIFIAIFIIALFFRLYDLAGNPAGFFADELSNGLEAKSILTTGKDTYSRRFPVIFEALGDFRDPVYIYTSIPSILVFGLNEFSMRFTSVLYGVAAVLAIYFMVKEFGSGDKFTALVSSLLLAITPWHVHMSRVGFQLIAAVFFLITALYFTLRSIRTSKFIVLAGFLWIFTFFSYHPAKIYIPPLFLFLQLIYSTKIVNLLMMRKALLRTFLVFIVFGALLYGAYRTENFFARYEQVRKDMTMSEKGTAFLNHFHPDFLFLKGDAGFEGQYITRHSIVGLGELHLFQAPFLILGIFVSIFYKKWREKYLFFVLFLLVYPLGSIFTEVAPQATRSVLGVIPLTVLSAIGISDCYERLKGKYFRQVFQVSFIVIILVSSYSLFYRLNESPRFTSGYWGWQYGMKESIQYYLSKSGMYDEFVITHRFNMGHVLLDYYKTSITCPNCRLENPIPVEIEKRQLFALRPEDIEEIKLAHPRYKFFPKKIIFTPGGDKEMIIGIYKITQNEESAKE